MEGSGTFEQFEFFASASDQRWVEVGWILQLEVRQRQELLLEACIIAQLRSFKEAFCNQHRLSHNKEIVGTVFESTSTRDEDRMKKLSHLVCWTLCWRVD